MKRVGRDCIGIIKDLGENDFTEAAVEQASSCCDKQLDTGQRYTQQS